jgi:hypothetical protein
VLQLGPEGVSQAGALAELPAPKLAPLTAGAIRITCVNSPPQEGHLGFGADMECCA